MDGSKFQGHGTVRAVFLTQSGYLMAHADSSLFVKAREGKLADVRCTLVGYCDADYTGDHDMW